MSRERLPLLSTAGVGKDATELGSEDGSGVGNGAELQVQVVGDDGGDAGGGGVFGWWRRCRGGKKAPAAAAPPKQGNGFLVAVCLAVNGVIGTGILVMPYGFERAGVVLGLIIGTVVGVLVTMASCERVSSPEDVDSPEPKDLPQPNGLLHMLYGTWGLVFYTVALVAYELFGLWTYSTVFGATLTHVLSMWRGVFGCDVGETGGECFWVLATWLAIFGVLVTYLTFREFSDSDFVFVQVVLFFLRLAFMLLVIATSAIGLAQEGHMGPEPTPLFRIDGSLYALMSSHLAITWMGAMRQKRHATRVIVVSNFGIGLSYVSAALLAAMRFASCTLPQINLNYSNYNCDGCDAGWVWFVRVFQLLFPALDCLSIFVQVSVMTAKVVETGLQPIVPPGGHRVLWACCRLGTSLIPTVLALTRLNLADIIGFNAYPAAAVALLMPLLLHVKAPRIGRSGWVTLSLLVLVGGLLVAAVALDVYFQVATAPPPITCDVYNTTTLTPFLPTRDL